MFRVLKDSIRTVSVTTRVLMPGTMRGLGLRAKEAGSGFTVTGRGSAVGFRWGVMRCWGCLKSCMYSDILNPTSPNILSLEISLARA